MGMKEGTEGSLKSRIAEQKRLMRMAELNLKRDGKGERTSITGEKDGATEAVDGVC